MSLIELYPITINQYLSLCNFNPDFDIPDVNKRYLTQLYSNGNTQSGFKLIHKLIFFPKLLIQYLDFCKDTNIDLQAFLLQMCDKVSLIQLCINCNLVQSFQILCDISNLLFLDGIYNCNNCFNEFQCKALELYNSKSKSKSESEIIHLDNYELYTYVKNNKSLNLHYNRLNLQIDYYDFFIKNPEINNNYILDYNFYKRYLDLYYNYRKELYNVVKSKSDILNLILNQIYKNYKYIDINKITDIQICKIIVQLYKFPDLEVKDLQVEQVQIFESDYNKIKSEL
jgi:hypothetical protein